jgi:hypothetical protein
VLLEDVAWFSVLRSRQGLVALTGASVLRAKPDLLVPGAVESRSGAREMIQSSDSTRTNCVEGGG